MNLQRRALLRNALLAGGATMVAALSRAALSQAAESPKEQRARAAVERATRGMSSPRIRDVRLIEVAVGGGSPLSIVKVITDQDGLYGYGDATVATIVGSRAKLLRPMVDYLKPLVVDRPADRIDDIWQLCYTSSYYKNDQVQNSAISGVCDALWDIKGRQAGMPVYQLVGGKCRDGAEAYVHLSGNHLDPQRVVELAKAAIAQGLRNVQIDLFIGDSTAATLTGAAALSTGVVPFDRQALLPKALQAFEALRKEVPAHIRLGTDCHSLLDTASALQFTKGCEAFGPWYWLEDPIPAEDAGYLRVLREHCIVPIAMGELWDNPAEWRPVIEQRSIDYMRHHVSHIGGFTAARKIAAYAENFQVKTGWHSADVSPVGLMANLTLDLTSTNFGIHEHFPLSDRLREVFHGSATVLKNGYEVIENEAPGWGIEVDEAAAAKFPPGAEHPSEIRGPDNAVLPGPSV